MELRLSRRPRHAEEGFALIEVIVSALIVVLTTAGVVHTLTATGHASAEERHRSQAYAVAQEDQARMRSLRIADLQQGSTARTVTLNTTPYRVTSTATYVTNKTGTTNCGTEGSADYIRIGTQVTWPSRRENVQPVLLESIDSPVSGSIDPTSGGFAISIRNGENKPLSGFGIKGAGPAPFSGSTNSEGCALFGGLPAGTYSIIPSAGTSGYVDPNGNPPAEFSQAIVGGTTVPIEEEYDIAGGFSSITFKARNANGTYYAEKVDSALINQTGMSLGPHLLGTPGGTPVSKFSTEKTYFPFSTPYNITAGSCAVTEPESGESTPTLGAGKEVMAEPVLLPVLYFTVKNSLGSTAEKEGVGGARVTLTDLNCKYEGAKVKRVFTTTTTKTGSQAPRVGALAETSAPGIEAPGLPAGEYELCVSKGTKHVTLAKVLVISPTGALTVEGVVQKTLPYVIDLGGSLSKSGECP
jgi:type II secretory pathway pseudopilin PulG